MDIQEFTVNQTSTEQWLSLYVIVCTKEDENKIYVGQTGNQSTGCSNITYRLGKHLGYTGTDNTLRNKLGNPEKWQLEVIFVHVYEYDGTNSLVNDIKALESYLINKFKEKYKSSGLVLNDSTIPYDSNKFSEGEKSMLSNLIERVASKLITRRCT